MSRATRIRRKVRHAFGIFTLTKSLFGKNQSCEILTRDRRTACQNSKQGRP